MKFKIYYNLKGGNVNANIIWDSTNYSILNNDIVLDGHFANEQKIYGIEYKYYKCKRDIDPFSCEKLTEPPLFIDLYGRHKVSFDWLKFGKNGMDNCGQTCYFNSFMQCILFTYPLIYHVKLINLNQNMKSQNVNYQSQIEEENKELMDRFNDLINRKFSDYFNNSYIPMNDLVEFFIDKEIMNQLFNESDSQEYFSKFINQMKSIYPKTRGKNLFDYYFNFDLQIVLNKKIKNTTIIESNPTSETDILLSLPIVDNNLEICLDEFFKEEMFDEDNKKIKDEPKKENYSKKLMLFNLPKILVIHLKRYDGQNNFINSHVNMPDIIHPEKLKKYFAPEHSIEEIFPYDLYAFSVFLPQTHTQITSNHYISYINKPTFLDKEGYKLRDYNEKFAPGWYLADDSKFEVANIFSYIEHKLTGYLYFYKARDNPYYHHIGNEDVRFTYYQNVNL